MGQEMFEINFSMRSAHPLQSRFTSVLIEHFGLDSQFRDETAKVLLALHFLYNNKIARRQLFSLLQHNVAPDVNHALGRPSMTLCCMVVLTLLAACQQQYANIPSCSFNRCFHSPSNRQQLDTLLELNALPKKSRLNATERARGHQPAFAEAGRPHPALSCTRST